MVSREFTSPRALAVRGILLAICAGGGLSACASVAPMPGDLASPLAQQGGSQPHNPARYDRAQASAQTGPRYKVGAPYQAGGVWYVPAEQPAYDEVGTASWYGDEFNGKPTANGELFDMNGVSGAHATLPMPSIVEVTNLDNGRKIEVRLNDRGPFHPGRIIDLSRGAAQQLGFFDKGTAQVRVRFVRPAPLLGSDAPTQIASNRMYSMLPPAPVSPALVSPSPSPSVSEDSASRAKSGFTIQAGAFSARANADRAAVRLASAGRTAVLPVDRNGARLYRVTVGSFPRAEDASAARTRVSAMGFAEARVVAGS